MASVFEKMGATPRLEPNLINDRASALLRNSIIAGRIPPATKLAEREVAQFLGISRAPARDALRELEKEGLIVSKPNGRYVIELTERDIRQLYEIRSVLERLAAEQAADNTSPAHRAGLQAKLDQLTRAVKSENVDAFVESDVEIHRLIWKQTENQHLIRVLNSMVGPIFMFVASNAHSYDWTETLELHRDLVNCINSGDAQAAGRSLAHHMNNALHRSLMAFQQAGESDDGQALINAK